MGKTRFLRADIARGINSGNVKGVDRDFKHDKGKGAIFGYAVIAKGTLNDQDIRDWEMDDISLDQVVELGNQKNIGLKSRFGHPNISGEALGTFLGRAKNFRKDGDLVRADLYIDETAHNTPNGDLATYIMDLAETDPDAFGSSLVFDADFAYRLNEDGTKKKDEEGNELPALVRFTKVYASDIVDDPAATPGMFGKFFNSSVELSAKATEFLDKFLNSPDAIEHTMAFLERYRKNRVDIDKENNNLTKKEEVEMELKEITVDQLKAERPDLVATLKAEGVTEGVKTERARALAIVKAEHTEFAGMKMEALSEKAIEEGLTQDATLASMREKRLKDIELERNPAPGADGDTSKVSATHLDKAKAYAKEHNCNITEALRATAVKRVKK
ncbi:MAG: hypothetical protein PHC54_05445 [Candidatus Omnitrophica bacterium]|nr:hypothetical protein [Candidatus Omnitrophota bacterium]MDD5592655.1 hypothetical protein [Candidatus Omnitrophota bacterium]